MAAAQTDEPWGEWPSGSSGEEKKQLPHPQRQHQPHPHQGGQGESRSFHRKNFYNHDNNRPRRPQGVDNRIYNNFGVHDLRELLNKRRSERGEEITPTTDPTAGSEGESGGPKNDPNRNRDKRNKSNNSPKGDKEIKTTNHRDKEIKNRDIESPHNIKIQFSTSTGDHTYSVDQESILPTIKHVPDYRRPFSRGYRGRGGHHNKQGKKGQVVPAGDGDEEQGGSSELAEARGDDEQESVLPTISHPTDNRRSSGRGYRGRGGHHNRQGKKGQVESVGDGEEQVENFELDSEARGDEHESILPTTSRSTNYRRSSGRGYRGRGGHHNRQGKKEQGEPAGDGEGQAESLELESEARGDEQESVFSTISHPTNRRSSGRGYRGTGGHHNRSERKGQEHMESLELDSEARGDVEQESVLPTIGHLTENRGSFGRGHRGRGGHHNRQEKKEQVEPVGDGEGQVESLEFDLEARGDDEQESVLPTISHVADNRGSSGRGFRGRGGHDNRQEKEGQVEPVGEGEELTESLGRLELDSEEARCDGDDESNKNEGEDNNQ